MIVPDTITPFVGWRAWVADEGAGPRDLVLDSLYYPLRWPRQAAAVAGCEFGDKAPCPADRHPCGIYAATDPAGAVDYLPERLRTYTRCPIVKPTRLVLGRVQLWGEVEEHAAGYRAQYAYPLELHVPVAYRLRDGDQPVLADEARDLLAAGYQVPVSLFRRGTDLA